MAGSGKSPVKRFFKMIAMAVPISLSSLGVMVLVIVVLLFGALQQAFPQDKNYQAGADFVSFGDLNWDLAKARANLNERYDGSGNFDYYYILVGLKMGIAPGAIKAIHAKETSLGGYIPPGNGTAYGWNTDPLGAWGPFQITYSKWGTDLWSMDGTDGDGDGIVDPHNFADLAATAVTIFNDKLIGFATTVRDKSTQDRVMSLLKAKNRKDMLLRVYLSAVQYNGYYPTHGFTGDDIVKFADSTYTHETDGIGSAPGDLKSANFYPPDQGPMRQKLWQLEDEVYGFPSGFQATVADAAPEGLNAGNQSNMRSGFYGFSVANMYMYYESELESKYATKKTVGGNASVGPGTYPPNPQNATGDMVAQWASQWVGRAKYDQGRRMQDGYFDCSSLVFRAYQAFGITVGTWTGDQSSSGVELFIDKSKSLADQLAPGDILLRDPNGSRAHVWMYIGNGKTVAAADPMRGVILGDVAWADFTQARRIINIHPSN